ncbi:MAG: glutathione S-transferase N-terminal domain-containing protein [Polyangiaceae bacterium]
MVTAQAPTRPPSAAEGPARLITIRFSHYCEKARWALDRAHIPYIEDAHPPIFSWAQTKRLPRARSVPVLVANGKTYPDSNDILRYVDAHTPAYLQPLCMNAGEDEPLRKLFDESLGPAARRFVYGYLLDDAPVARRLLSSQGSKLERKLAYASFPVLREMIRRGLRIDAAGVERSRLVIERVFGAVEERIKDGRPYLQGDAFTAADLSFASLASPLVFPSAYETFSLPVSEGPRALVPFVDAFRRSPAGKFALSIYERERVPKRAVEVPS